jgi:hypothetical protein
MTKHLGQIFHSWSLKRISEPIRLNAKTMPSSKRRKRAPNRAPPKKRAAAFAHRPKHAPDNVSKSRSDLKDLNFKVHHALYRAFKLISAAQGVRMKALLENAVRCWVNLHGTEEMKGWLPPE